MDEEAKYQQIKRAWAIDERCRHIWRLLVENPRLQELSAWRLSTQLMKLGAVETANLLTTGDGVFWEKRGIKTGEGFGWRGVARIPLITIPEEGSPWVSGKFQFNAEPLPPFPSSQEVVTEPSILGHFNAFVERLRDNFEKEIRADIETQLRLEYEDKIKGLEWALEQQEKFITELEGNNRPTRRLGTGITASLLFHPKDVETLQLGPASVVTCRVSSINSQGRDYYEVLVASAEVLAQ